jgi:hypothetical protein
MFRDLMRQIGPGAEIRMEVQRANRLHSVKLKLGEQPKVKAAK